ncbi:MAG: class I SAM-dependent methyltransferase [Planctomycetes bacterium]|nr:class I SAM-dependent methyltransferase [Planctomycetota bacterium]
MKTQTLTTVGRPAAPSATRTPWLQRAVLARLARIDQGSLTVEVDGARHVLGRPDDARAPHGALRVRDARFWSAVARRGSVGAGEAYAAGWWTSDAPAEVVRVMVRNQGALVGLEGGLARLSRPLLAAYHALRDNTERGSRANIAAHYDLSNEFFALFLDDTMTYSCGVFERPDASLREASVAKIDRLCRKLELSPRDHLLEIGTGWGALAIHAAREYGCRVTTTTISREQHALAAERIRAAGLEDRIDLRFEDYRRLTGTYDKLVSVEMIEAVGHRWYGAFFQRCAELLTPEGTLALQAITIADQHYEAAKNAVDFIQRHIFPGSCIPSVTALCDAATRASDLRLVDLEDIGAHYVPTLAAWNRNLRARWDDAKALGHDETFLRLWEFYFAYCEGGFAERHIGDVQLLLQRPLARPALRARPLEA